MASMSENVKILQSKISGLEKKYLEVEKLNKSLKDRLAELYSLYQISFALSLTFDLEEILKSIKKMFKKNLNIDKFSLMLLNESANCLKIISSYGIANTVRNRYLEEDHSNIFYQALESKAMIHVPDMRHDDRFSYYSHSKKIQEGSFLTIPLKPEHNFPFGVINFYRKEGNSFSEQDIELLEKIAEQVANVVEKTLLYKQTKELSVTDELTGLNNRRYLNQRLEREVIRAKRYKRPLSVIMIDIDHFKQYNDINGHPLGDEVLKKVAALLEHSIRKADILARYGGEEFVLLLPEINKHGAFKVAEKLRLAIASHSFPGEDRLPHGKVTISLGLSTLLEDTYNAGELIEFADKALYQAKKMGRNRAIGYHYELNGEYRKNYLFTDSVAS